MGRRLNETEAEGIIKRSKVNEGSPEAEKLDKKHRWLEFDSKNDMVFYLNYNRSDLNWDTMLAELNADAQTKVAKVNITYNRSGGTWDRGTAVAFYENGRAKFYYVKKT